MRVAITGVRDGLILIGLALLVCLLLVGTFAIADEYHIDSVWVFCALSPVALVPVLWGAFRGRPKKRFLIPFVAAAAIVHGFIFLGLMKWEVPGDFWLPIMGVELFLVFWVAYRLFGVIPSDDS